MERILSYSYFVLCVILRSSPCRSCCRDFCSDIFFSTRRALAYTMKYYPIAVSAAAFVAGATAEAGGGWAGWENAKHAFIL